MDDRTEMEAPTNRRPLQKAYRFRTPAYFRRQAGDDDATPGVLWDGLKEFTSVHGLQNHNRARGSVKRVFWLATMLLMTCGLCYNFRGLASNFLLYPVKVEVSIARQTREMVFPAVTVCNMNPVRKSAFEAVENSQTHRTEVKTSNVKRQRRRKRTTETCGQWQCYKKFCYCASSAPTTMKNVNVTCSNICAVPLTIRDIGEYDFAKNFILKTFNGDCYLGAHRNAKTDRLINYFDGTPSAPSDGWWAADEPNGSGYCVRIFLATSTASFELRDCACNDTYNYICKKSNSTSCTTTTPLQTTTAPRTTYQSTPPVTTTTEALSTTTTALATTEPIGQTTEEISTSKNIVETTVEIITEIILETATETVSQTTSETVIDTTLQTTAETTLEPSTKSTEQAIVETTREAILEITTEITAATSLATTTEMTTESDEETIPKTSTTTTAAATTTTTTTTNPATTSQPLSASSNQPTTPEELTGTPSRPGQFLTTTTANSLPQVNCCCRCCFDAAEEEEEEEEEEDFESCNLCSNDTLESSFACALQRPAVSLSTTSKPRPTSTAAVPVVYDRSPFIAPSPINGSRFPKRTVETKAFLDGEEFLEMMTTLAEQDKIDLGYSLKDMILRCQYADTQCQNSEFETFYNSLHGNCFVFNSGWNDSKPLRIVRRNGKTNGMRMLVNIGQIDYIANIGDTSGIRVIVHPQKIMSFPEDEGITISPGHFTSVSIRKVVESRLPLPYSHCATNATNDPERNFYAVRHPVDYSRRACEKTCYQRHLMANCSCMDSCIPHGTVNDSAHVPACSRKNITQDDCRYLVMTQFGRDALSCDCPDPCRRESYSYSVSMKEWPSLASRTSAVAKLSRGRNLGFNISDIRAVADNLLEFELYFEDLTYELFEEKISYSMINFASDLGGILGLWFGFAVFSIFEFCEFFSDVVVLIARKSRERTSSRTNTMEKIRLKRTPDNQ